MTVPRRSHAIRIPASRSARKTPSHQTSEKGAAVSLPRPPPPPPPANAKTARRSSSVYSRTTVCWDDLSVWDGGAPPPLPTCPPMGNKKFSESSPELSSPDVSPLTPDIQDTLPSLLEPRTYQPFPPRPLPYLTPASMRRRTTNIATSSVVLPKEGGDKTWASLDCSEIQMSPSPPPLSPFMPEELSVLSNHSTIRMEQTNLEDARARPDALRTSATLSGPFDSRASDGLWRNNSIDRAFSHMRLGSDVSVTSGRHSDDQYDQGVQLDCQSQSSGDILSSDYRNELIEEYRNLVAPPAGHWQEGSDTSDAETTGYELKMVPAPLFYQNRQKELHPHRAVYAQQEQPGLESGRGPDVSLARSRKKKILRSKTPLHKILPLQYRPENRNSEPGDSPTTAALKRALALRHHAKKADLDRHSAEGQPRTFHGKLISRPLQEGLMPLQLPKIAYRDLEAKNTTLKSPPSSCVRTKYARRLNTDSSGFHGSETLESPLEYTAPRDKDISRLPDPDFARSRRPRHTFRPSQNTERVHISMQSPHPPTTPGFAGFIHRRPRGAEDHLTTRKGHAPNESNKSQHVFERKVESAFSPDGDEKKSSMMPAFFDKALDAMRERERNKRRKDLKSQIKFVGQADPEKIDQDGVKEQKQRRETFGEGWI